MAILNPERAEIHQILNKAERIAVVGLSDNPERTSYQISERMQQEGYTIIPVNPKVDEVLGEKAVASLADIEGHVDIVDIFRRSEFLPALAEEFDAIDADVFWAQSGISDETAYDFLKERGHTVIMDRCIMVEYLLSGKG
ncbi:CoA-binding protein [Listeria booriae]|uniref:CoA-binding protein n=1 Tax=Listeria booriae TaxID=1552123 RepID=A0A7X1CBL5_9LIST|nr:CoA-binding protein [Listeria booriae]MBC1491360.1 CoA-binding protein [Listeria booriae]MBC1504666.1 CoA-binding protein [Listeria booriae]MBC1523698.1 CoA-binding protein [Listeria booriae]MBC1530583.1 CoA-binding protein [Listeria booriae]MBC6133645.1 CoA-binding protein [Listeria booriae]